MNPNNDNESNSTAFKAVLPGEAWERYERAFESHHTPSEVMTVTTEFNRTFLPPSSATGFYLSCTLAHRLSIFSDHNDQRLEKATAYWHRLCDGKTQFSKHDSIKTQFPVFGALTILGSKQNFEKFGHLTHHAVTLYISLSRNHTDSPIITPSTFYQDALHLRDALLAITKDFYRTEQRVRNHEEFVELVRDRLVSASELYLNETLEIPDAERDTSSCLPRNFNFKAYRVLQLFDKARYFGEPTRSISKSARTPGFQNNIPPSMPGEERDIQEPEPDIPDTYTIDLDSSTVSLIETDESGTSVIRNTSPLGSRIGSKDDRRQLANISSHIASSNVLSLADPGQITLMSLVRFLSYLWTREPDYVPICLLLCLTGISSKRLALAREFNRLDPIEEEPIYVDTKRQLLLYRILNGIDNSDTSLQQSTMLLSMPSHILESISQHVKTGSIARSIDIIQDLARAFSRHSAGPSPTPERLSRHFWHHVSPGFGAEIIASQISGAIPYRLRGVVHYQKFRLDEINKKFQDVAGIYFKRIINSSHCEDNLRKSLPEISWENKLPAGEIGSKHVEPIEVFSNLAKQLRISFRKRHRDLSMCSGEDLLPLYRDLINIQNINLYLMQQMFFMLRPVGRVATTATATGFAFSLVSDKSSSMFRESGAAPTPKVLLDQLRHCRIALERFTVICEKLGIVVQSEHIEQTDTAIFVKRPHHQHLRIEKMTGGHFLDTLGELELKSLVPSKRNSVRHCLASHLRNRLPEAVLREFMRHKTGGLDITSPISSSSNLCANTTIQTFIGLADKVFPEALQITER